MTTHCQDQVESWGQSFLLNDTSTQHSLQLMGDGQCEVRMLAVGGGGYGTSYGGGGGGSGFIAYYADVLPGFTELTVTVGDSDEFLSDSSKVLANGEVILEAGPGRSGGYGGGDGFSGGGGDSSSTAQAFAEVVADGLANRCKPAALRRLADNVCGALGAGPREGQQDALQCLELFLPKT